MISGLNTLNAVRKLDDHPYEADQWMVVDLNLCGESQLLHILQRYESGMIYVPTLEIKTDLLATLMMQQTSGLASLFQPKTYQPFLAFQVFLAMGNGYYVVDHTMKP